MNIEFITPSVQFVDDVNGCHIMRKLEKCARTCYQSESKQHTEPTADFLRGIIKSGHTSVLEHESITLDITTDRGVLAELTRHRIGVGYSVESTRYVNYSKGVEFVIPVEYDKNAKVFPDGKALDVRYKIFQEACETAAYAYNQLIKNGAKRQEARAVLPQALKVNMKVTMNIRAWRHFFELRCASSAHPNMREIAIAILLEFRKKMLPLFEDIEYDKDFYINHKTRIDNIFHVSTKATMRTFDDDQKWLKDRYEEYMKSKEKEKVDKMAAAKNLDEKKEDKKSVNEAFDELCNVFSKMEEEYQKTKKEPLRDYEHGPITRRELENEKLVRDIEEMLNKHATRMEEKIDKMTAAMELDEDVKDEPEIDLLDILSDIDKNVPNQEQLEKQFIEDLRYLGSMGESYVGEMWRYFFGL